MRRENESRRGYVRDVAQAHDLALAENLHREALAEDRRIDIIRQVRADARRVAEVKPVRTRLALRRAERLDGAVRTWCKRVLVFIDEDCAADECPVKYRTQWRWPARGHYRPSPYDTLTIALPADGRHRLIVKGKRVIGLRIRDWVITRVGTKHQLVTRRDEFAALRELAFEAAGEGGGA